MNLKHPEGIRNLFSRRYWFRDCPNPAIPAVAAGVYVVWRGDELIYAGMSGKDIEKNQQKRKYGLVTRLSSHASGRLSGDQMNVYVANRFVVPEIDAAQQAEFAARTLRADAAMSSNNALISILTKQRQQLLICLGWTQYSVNRINIVAFCVKRN